MAFDAKRFAELAYLEAHFKISPYATRLPAKWKRGVRPSDTLPIDDEIEALLARQRLPKALPSSKWPARLKHLGCPYAAARAATGHAAIWARYSQLGGDTAPHFASIYAALKDNDRHAVVVDKIFPAVQQLLKLPEAYEPQDGDDFEKVARSARKILDALIVLKINLPAVAEFAGREHLRLTQNQGNIWKIEFTTALGHFWHQVTGASPSSSSDPFKRFVAAAWSSLSTPEPPDEAWDRAIRTACKRNSGRWSDEPPSPADAARSSQATLAVFQRFAKLTPADERGQEVGCVTHP